MPYTLHHISPRWTIIYWFKNTPKKCWSNWPQIKNLSSFLKHFNLKLTDQVWIRRRLPRSLHLRFRTLLLHERRREWRLRLESGKLWRHCISPKTVPRTIYGQLKYRFPSLFASATFLKISNLEYKKLWFSAQNRLI